MRDMTQSGPGSLIRYKDFFFHFYPSSCLPANILRLYVPGNLWKGFGIIMPACGKKGFMPGGSIPAMEVARGWTRPASPNGFPNCSCAAAAEDEGMLGARPATGEVGSETGDTEDCGWLQGASVTYRGARH